MTDNKGRTSLILAAENGHITTVQLLLSADPSAKHIRMMDDNGRSALGFVMGLLLVSTIILFSVPIAAIRCLYRVLCRGRRRKAAKDLRRKLAEESLVKEARQEEEHATKKGTKNQVRRRHTA